jgi:bifunctional non-homologous end joining protein LigD
MATARRDADTTVLRGVAITNATKVWWPDEGITKLDIARYYLRVAPHLNPWLADRPLSAERCPDGMRGHCFYQKDFASLRARGLRTAPIRAESARRTLHYAVGGSTRTLLVLVNLGTIPIHVMNGRLPALDRPDWVAFDLDPPAAFADAARAALALRRVLDDLGLRSYPKTTGGKGVHVLVPLRRGPDQEEVRAFAQAVGQRVVERHHDLATLTFSKAGRGGRVYVDIMRNATSQTIVPPYAVRRRPRAPVSTPLAWDEVDPGLDPAAYNVRTLGKRLGSADPWADFWRDRQRLPALAAAA